MTVMTIATSSAYHIGQYHMTAESVRLDNRNHQSGSDDKFIDSKTQPSASDAEAALLFERFFPQTPQTGDAYLPHSHAYLTHFTRKLRKLLQQFHLVSPVFSQHVK